MEGGGAQVPAQDAGAVTAAFRFGWAIAELRGRYRPNVSHDDEHTGAPELKRSEHDLPLSPERSPSDQRGEVILVVEGLSRQLGLAFPEAQGLDAIMPQLDAKPEDTDAWNALTEVFYSWDKKIQDALVLMPLLSAGYQLGRGLAETYWELDPAITDPLDSRSWDVVLGPERRSALKRLTGRLATFVDPLTIPAIGVSLEAWGEVAADPVWRVETDARKDLYKQGLLWRDLVRGERRPEDLVVRKGVAGRVGVILPFLRAFWPQLLIGVVAVAALVVGASQLTTSSGSKSGDTLISILGGLGVTSASLYARAKATATSTLGALRKAFDADRVGAAATLRPKAPFKTRASLKRLPATAAKQLGYR